MKKLLFLLLSPVLVSTQLIAAAEKETAASLEVGEEQGVVETSELVNLPPEVQYNIVEKLIENIKDKNSLQEALKTIASLEQASTRFANLIEQNKNIFKNKLVDQIKENIINVDLIDAAKFKSPILAEILIEQGADVNAKQHGGTPLHVAAVNNSKEVAVLLIAAGADVDVKDSITGLTPLDAAAVNNSKEVAELLIANGADVNAKDDEDYTPLHNAVLFDAIDVAKLLIENNADVFAKNNEGQMPLDLAESDEMKQLLQEAMKKQSARN